MLLVEGWLKLAKGDGDKLMDAARTMVAKTRREEGCLHYCYGRDIDDPDLIRISERWRDDAALTAHFTAPHMGDLNAALGKVSVEGVDVRLYDGEEVRKLM